MGCCNGTTYHSVTGTTFAALVRDLVDVEAEFDRATVAASAAANRQSRIGQRMSANRELARAAIKATAGRTGHDVADIALVAGDYAVAMVDREVRVFRLIQSATRDQIQETTDIIGHRLYSAGCTPEEAGVPSRTPPPTAEAVVDLADEDGFVPASALGAMREAAAAQAFGSQNNVVG